MTTEAWVTLLAAVGAALLGAAAAAGVLQRRGQSRRVRAAAVTMRATSVVALLAAVVVAATADGILSLLGVRLVTVNLILAASAIHLALSLVHGRPGGLWPVDAFLAGLLALMLLVAAPGGDAGDCARLALPFFVEWTLYLFGGGALLVAGSTGAVALATRRRNPRPDGSEEPELMIAALLLTLVVLGGGLLVGMWWAWRTTGALLASDQRQMWVAAAWMLAGMALIAGELEEHQYRWMAALAVAGASVAIFGLLALPDVMRLWGG